MHENPGTPLGLDVNVLPLRPCCFKVVEHDLPSLLNKVAACSLTGYLCNARGLFDMRHLNESNTASS